jgi:levanase
MKLSSLFGDRSMLEDPALAHEIEAILRSDRGCALSRRSAFKLIAGVPATLLVYGCFSGGSSTPPPPPTPTPTQARPRFHLTPASGWINDPQRPLWINGTWNLWVLWNADFPSGNGTAWRRYTSSDLVNWTDKGISIPKYTTNYGDVWTGSTVVDTNNTAGYGAGAVIAIMTMPCNSLGGQGSGLWYSTDGGTSFQFGAIVQTNPLAGNTSISDLVFRDPCIFWHAPTGRWVMSLAEVGKLSVYSSVDLKNWVHKSAMARMDLGTLECPHLFPLHLYNSDGTTTEDKWVLLCGANGTSQGFTTGTAYWVGGFDGVTFTPDSSSPRWLDAGPDFYATAVFADANASDSLEYAFAIAWENNWDYATTMPTSGYFGQLSIVRQLHLQTVNGASVLLNMPIASQSSVFQSTSPGTDQTISDAVAYQWPAGLNTYSCQIDLTLSSESGSWAGEIDLAVRSGGNDVTRVGFKPAAHIVFLDRSKCGTAPKSDAAWNSRRQAPCDFAAPVSMSVFIDAGSIEVFVNGGRALSELITTPSDATGLSLTASGGSARVSKLVVRY